MSKTQVTIYEWVLDRIPRPYELSMDVPGHWRPIQVTPDEAEKLLRGRGSWRYRASLSESSNYTN